jgi:hypothetical protein
MRRLWRYETLQAVAKAIALQRLVVPMTALISAVWFIAFMDGVLTKDYTPLGVTTPLMLIAAGATYASYKESEKK